MNVKLDENIPSRLAGELTDLGHDVHTVARTHPGLLLVRLREPGANALLNRIKAVVQSEGLDSFARCFVVLTDRKLRIRRS